MLARNVAERWINKISRYNIVFFNKGGRKIDNKGYTLVNFCEFDKYAEKSYCAIHNVDPNLNLGDITKVNEKEIADFNMMVGGSPCQDFSVAGKQKGAEWNCVDCKHKYNPLEVHYQSRNKCPKCGSENIEKTRSSLVVEWLRILKEKKPKLAIYENVKNLIGKKHRYFFDLFIEELHEYRYNTYWNVLNAKQYGVPQNRERVFLIIIRKDVDDGKFEFPQGFDNGLRLKDFLEDEVDEKFYISDDKVEKLISQIKDKNQEISYCIDANYYKGITPEQFLSKSRRQLVVVESAEGIDKSYNDPKLIDTANCITSREDRGISNRKDEGLRFFKDGCVGTLRTIDACGDKRVLVKEATKQGYAIAEEGDSINIQFPNSETRRGRVGKGVAQTLETSCNQAVIAKDQRYIDNISDDYAFARKRTQEMLDNNGELPEMFNPYNKQEVQDIAPTITTSCDRSCSSATVLMKQTGYRIRKLTPLECWRLMGFSDEDFERAKWYKKQEILKILDENPNFFKAKAKRQFTQEQRIERMSNSQLYKQAGNSIVTDVLYYIYLELYKVMPYLFEDLKLGSFFSGIGAFEKALDRLYIHTNNNKERVNLEQIQQF